MFVSSSANANQGDSNGSWEYAIDYPRSPLPPLPLPTSSAREGDSDDPALEINDMKNKLEHNSSLVHYWTQKCVGAEQKLAYLTWQVNKARNRKEKHIIRAQRRKNKAEDFHMTEEDATYKSLSIHKGGDKHDQAMSVAFNKGFEKFRRFIADVHKDIDWDATTPSAS
ncbi:uncharacterized protein Pyn_01252 [Prunus yedoensis var. nudiflora]|uniref:Uncharacterized protein n=1 Tax=Prunus yedoensis var. nudiflora TaxID=2094558 RepID=A0A314UHD0_PRUYE|nr:uncharacterized protein Pyn_01252 [Prunus yedoensis var. nudiflora]